LLKADTPIK